MFLTVVYPESLWHWPYPVPVFVFYNVGPGPLYSPNLRVNLWYCSHVIKDKHW
jgi:hypothetical protein